ncbi:MAG: hypothetical protein LBJ11_03840 [Oscillospiraceae bacterium]|jgi:hypothetical protein|nr:hypothetical protein [Oscillospiraceae bacterium]
MKRVLLVLLAFCFCAAGLTVAATAAGNAYVIQNPYADVDWETWGTYKANLHVHTTFSDGDYCLRDMVEEYYRRGFDVLGTTDHMVVGRPWDQKPRTVPPFDIQNWGKPHDVLSTNRLQEITEGVGRGGRGMVQVPKGLEMNGVVPMKSHVNGFFAGWGQAFLGVDNDFRTAVAMTEKYGGVSFINHPGDWLHSENDLSVARDPANVNYFADILRDYPSCLGIEIYNDGDYPTRGDRVLWDELLTRLLPEGRQVWGFANDDSHNYNSVDNTSELMFMPKNTVENIRACMETGAFLACSRYDRIRLGDFAGDKNLPFPSVTNITVNQAAGTITLQTTGTDLVEWVADGKVIATGGTIDLAAHAEEMTCYVRAQLIGPGGISATQAFGLDDGTGGKHPDDALHGWAWVKWRVTLMFRKNIFTWLLRAISERI